MHYTRINFKHPLTIHATVLALDRELRSSATFDVAFLLDCTGSMESFLDAAKNEIFTFVESLARIYPDIPLSVAFVANRGDDYPDMVMHFTHG